MKPTEPPNEPPTALSGAVEPTAPSVAPSDLGQLEREIFGNDFYQKLLSQVAEGERQQIHESLQKLVRDFHGAVVQPLEKLLRR